MSHLKHLLMGDRHVPFLVISWTEQSHKDSKVKAGTDFGLLKALEQSGSGCNN